MDRSPILTLKGRVLANTKLPDEMFLLVLEQPELATTAQPGQFVHIECHPELTLRRPFSLLRTDPLRGVVEILYKVVGEGTKRLAKWKRGDTADLLGPIGRPFQLTEATAMLIAGGAGLPPMEFLATALNKRGVDTILLFGTETTPPFPVIQSALPVTGMESGVAFAHLETVGIPSRLASLRKRVGFFKGYVTELASTLLQALPEPERKKTMLYACGPHPMMAAAAQIAQRFNLPGEVSLEEHMACGFGGCAGCVAPIRTATPETWSYRRVCVDGPVFAMKDVAWEQY